MGTEVTSVVITIIQFKPLPVAVVVIFVITSQGGQATQADGKREEDLSSSIHPYLKTEGKQDRNEKFQATKLQTEGTGKCLKLSVECHTSFLIQ